MIGVVRCPNSVCGHVSRVERGPAGSRVRCPRCQSKLIGPVACEDSRDRPFSSRDAAGSLREPVRSRGFAEFSDAVCAARVRSADPRAVEFARTPTRRHDGDSHAFRPSRFRIRVGETSTIGSTPSRMRKPPPGAVSPAPRRDFLSIPRRGRGWAGIHPGHHWRRPIRRVYRGYDPILERAGHSRCPAPVCSPWTR